MNRPEIATVEFAGIKERESDFWVELIRPLRVDLEGISGGEEEGGVEN